MSTHGPSEQPELHRILARMIDNALNGMAGEKPNGFVLLTFKFGQMDNGRINYVSNGQRADIIVALKELLGRFEGHDHDHPKTPQ